ncbi:hypothetical protein OE88DRAFT_1412165 [Heliocybe sulcata]|uniref:Uncharacterized protein n=1 Tax=Heliocybe sulcata TaxID=5364 RepID=A0A5C3N6T0_9AGAM|nr:hypothetical protein OE88DRAFT_1412165 [Heliocybe sulcata]
MRQTKRAEQEAEYLRRQALLAESADVQIREPEFEEGYGFARQSPSSAHNNNQTRPTQGHQRRGSDTMRSLHSGSPTAVEALPPRLSPSGTGLKHRRNPTASEVPTVNGKNGKAQGRAYAGESKAKRYSAEDDPDNAVPAENNYAEPRQQGENQPSGPAPGLLVNGLYSDKRNIFVSGSQLAWRS